MSKNLDAGVPQKCPTCGSDKRELFGIRSSNESPVGPWEKVTSGFIYECCDPWHDAGVPSSPSPVEIAEEREEFYAGGERVLIRNSGVDSNFGPNDAFEQKDAMSAPPKPSSPHAIEGHDFPPKDGTRWEIYADGEFVCDLESYVEKLKSQWAKLRTPLEKELLEALKRMYDGCPECGSAMCDHKGLSENYAIALAAISAAQARKARSNERSEKEGENA